MNEQIYASHLATIYTESQNYWHAWVVNVRLHQVYQKTMGSSQPQLKALINGYLNLIQNCIFQTRYVSFDSKCQ